LILSTLSKIPSSDNPVVNITAGGLISSIIWSLFKEFGKIISPIFLTLPTTGSLIHDGILVFFVATMILLSGTFIPRNGDSADDRESSGGENVDIEIIPQHIEEDQSDDFGVSEDCVRIFDQVGKMRVVVSWPEEMNREWVELDAGRQIEFVFRDKPPDVDFDGSMFKLDRRCILGPFDVKIHPKEQINQRTLQFKGRDSDRVYRTIELRRAN
jgi:hypothetical protein